MNNTRWTVRLVLATAAGFAPFALLGQEALPKRCSEWERQASEWALKTYAQALKKAGSKARALLEAIQTTNVKPLPSEIREAHKERGFVLFQRSLGKAIARKVAPSPGEIKASALKVRVARNEWEAARLGVWSLREIKKLSFDVADLVHADGEHKILARDHVRRFFGFQMLLPKQRRKKKPSDDDIVVGRKLLSLGFEEKPAALLDIEALDLPKEEARALWIDIFAPKDALPGVYKSSVSIKVEGKEAAKRPLLVTVYPFVLDEAKEWGRGAFISKLRTPKQLVQMREHGMNMVSWWTTAGYQVKRKGGKIVCDFSAYQDYLKLLDKVGFSGPHAVFLGASDPKIQNQIFELLKRRTIRDARNPKSGKRFQRSDLSPPFGDYLCQALKQFHQQMKAVGHGDLVACLLDEPDHRPRPQRRQWYNRMYKLVEQGAPEVPTYGVFYHAGDEDRLSHHHTVWCSNRPAKRLAEVCRKAGKQLWTYHGGFKYMQPPARGRFRLGIAPWVFGASGSFFWAEYWHKGELFDPFSVKGTSTVSLPTPHGPLATPVLKGIREGIDDRRYLATLEKLIRKAQSSGSAEAKAEAAKDLAFLDSFRKPMFERMGVRGGVPNFESDNTGKRKLGRVEIKDLKGRTAAIDGAKSDTWAFSAFVRRDVARRIVSLQAKLKK